MLSCDGEVAVGWVWFCWIFGCWTYFSRVFRGFGSPVGSGIFFDCFVFKNFASAQMNAIDAAAPM